MKSTHPAAGARATAPPRAGLQRAASRSAGAEKLVLRSPAAQYLLPLQRGKPGRSTDPEFVCQAHGPPSADRSVARAAPRLATTSM
eukprot:9220811-Pyramimonas_sp.AAC.1